MDDQEKKIQELQHEVEKLTTSVENRNADMRKAAEERDAAKQRAAQLQKELDDAKMNDESKKVVEQYRIELETAKAEAEAKKAEMERLSAQLQEIHNQREAELKRQREELLAGVTEEKLRKPLESIQDIETLKSLIDALPQGTPRTDKSRSSTNSSGLSMDTVRKLSIEEQRAFARNHPDEYQRLLREEARKR